MAEMMDLEGECLYVEAGVQEMDYWIRYVVLCGG